MKNPMFYPLLVVGFILYLLCSSCKEISNGYTIQKVKRPGTSKNCYYELNECDNGFYAPCNQLKIGDTIQIISKH